MADFDQAVVNLERFIGLVANATSAVGQVEDHVAENGTAVRRAGAGRRERKAEGSTTGSKSWPPRSKRRRGRR